VTLTSGTMVSHYRIIDKIGAGGMGEVYLAEDTELSRKVALKFLPPHLCQDADCRTRFKREAQAAAKLNHPNIVTIHEVSEFNGRPFFAMESIAGESLNEYVNARKLSWQEIIGLAIQAVEGIAEAHRCGVVHRDVKPSNILVDSNGRVRILDFGLAAIKGEKKLTKTGSTLGTLHYMSPEQTRGEAVDERSDIFSLGVVLYELITGQLPFKGDHDPAIIYSIGYEEPEPLVRYKSGVSEDCQRIVTKAVAKDRRARYQHADELAADLRRLPTADVKPQAPRLELWNRYVVTSAVALLLAIVGYCGVTKYLTEGSQKPESARKTLAVLPFENIGQAEQEYFADGLTDEITTKLCGVSGLRVIARSSAVQYSKTTKPIAQIGKELGAGYLLQGTVRWEQMPHSSQRLRVNPQLVQVLDGTQVWSQSYESALAGVFDIQADIATQVAEALGVALLSAEQRTIEARPTSNAAAYEYYLRGIDYRGRNHPDSWTLAQLMFEKAIEADTGFALGYATLSMLHSQAYWQYRDHSARRLQMAKTCSDRALALDPRLPESHEASGYWYYHGSRAYDQAAEEFRQALNLRPNDVGFMLDMAVIERRLSRWSECVRHLESAVQLSPRFVDIAITLSETYLYLRRYDEADLWTERWLAIIPDDASAYRNQALLALQSNGDVAKAEAIADRIPLRNYMPSINGWSWEAPVLTVLDTFRRRALEQMDCQVSADTLVRCLLNILPYRVASDVPLESFRRAAYADSARTLLARFLREMPDDPRYHSLLGLTLAVSGQREGAVREGALAVAALPVTRDAITGSELLGNLAVIYLLVGKYDAAIDQLDQLLSIPSTVSVPLLRVDPTWVPVRSHPRFQKLLEKYGT